MARSTAFSKYFGFTIISLYLAAALPERKLFKNKLVTFLFNDVWPKVFLLTWCPLVPMVTLKIVQYISKEQWEEFLDIMHMYFLGCNCLYLGFATHKTASSFKNSVDEMKRSFKVWQRLSALDMYQVITLAVLLTICFLFYIGGSVYYGEVLVPLWVPFIDNDQEYPIHVFIGVWLYEIIAGAYIFLANAVLAPFSVVMTTVVVNELNYLIRMIENVKFDIKAQLSPTYKPLTSQKIIVSPFSSKNNAGTSRTKHDNLNFVCTSEKETKMFTAAFVEHHKTIWRVTKEVSTIYYHMYLTQILFTVFHSCFLAFNMYYTDRLTKVVLKSSPIPVFSYYSLFVYCWNGDRMTEAYEQLFRALYRCPWYDAPKSFKTSLNIMMIFCKRPVELAGGGIFKASLHSFSHGVQQSISYILLLKQLTPEK